ncbi:Acyl-RNA-complex protein 1 [Saitozyma sp. JCM 24511]|nr:Acyl-RNA-complex protein 1 [Saitozyma sp. JCM 24511]
MFNVAAFVAAAERADPSLVGASDKDKAAIAKLAGETEKLSKDLPISAPATQHPTHPSILRYFLHIQSLPSVASARKELPNDFPSLDIDVSTLPIPKREAVVPVKKEKKPKAAADGAGAGGVVEAVSDAVAGATQSAGAAVAAAGASVAAVVESAKEAVVGEATAVTGGAEGKKKDKKEKKEKKEKQPWAAAPAKPEPTGPMPSMIDMRVGKVLDVKKHPEADSLYVEQIDVGEPEPRTVCSGLVKYMSEDDIRGKSIIVICNLKPVTMRGVKSFAMLLCATAAGGKEDGGVQFVLPPEGSQPGERIYFEGEKYENATPEPQLNPKKKVFETIQPGFTTLDNLEACWIDPETKSVHKIRTKDGVCKAVSFVGASLS